MTTTLVDGAPPLNGKPLKCFGLNWPEVRVISAAQTPTHEQLCELSLDCLNAVIVQNFIKLRSTERNRQSLATKIRNMILEQRMNGFQVSNGEVAIDASLFQTRRMEREEEDRPFIGIGIFENEILDLCSEDFAHTVYTWSSQLTVEHIRFLLWSNVRTPVPGGKGKMHLADLLCGLIGEFRERGSIGMQYVNGHGDIAIMSFANGAAVPAPVVHPVADPARLEIQPLVVFEFALPALPVAHVRHSPERSPAVAMPEEDANDQGLDELERAARSLAVAAANSKSLASTARALEVVTRWASNAAASAAQNEQKLRLQFERLQRETDDI